MRLVSFATDAATGYGALNGDSIDVLGWGMGLRSLLGLSEGELANMPRLGQLALDKVRLLPPIPDAAKIFCVATNFHEPSRDGLPLPSYPLLFTRFADTLVGHGEDLLHPAETSAYDFEGEVALVIGKPGHKITCAKAMEHVAGYSCFNDGSVRDWQKHSTQFTPGKNFWRSGSFGPWLVTADEIPDPSVMELTTRVNGVVKQQISLKAMIFDIPWLVAYVSTFSPLGVGDVIVTGTPSGFGATRRPQEFLSVGDLIEVEVTPIGTLRNRVAAG